MEKTLKAEVPSAEVLRQSPMFAGAIEFWFIGNGHLRSPFRPEWREKVTEQSAEQFRAWLAKLDDHASQSVNDVIMSEKLEETIFGCAMELTTDEEQRLTILYPFLPRPGDPIDNGGAASRVVGRSIVKEGEDRFMEVRAVPNGGGTEWTTRFELP